MIAKVKTGIEEMKKKVEEIFQNKTKSPSDEKQEKKLK